MPEKSLPKLARSWMLLDESEQQTSSSSAVQIPPMLRPSSGPNRAQAMSANALDRTNACRTAMDAAVSWIVHRNS